MEEQLSNNWKWTAQRGCGLQFNAVRGLRLLGRAEWYIPDGARHTSHRVDGLEKGIVYKVKGCC